MIAFNKVTLMGYLTHDPDFRFTQSGTPICNMNLAVNDIVKASEPLFIKIVCFNKQAENCRDFLKRGSPIFVEGRLQVNTWQGEDGNKRMRPEVLAQVVQFLNSSSKSSNDNAWDKALGDKDE